MMRRATVVAAALAVVLFSGALAKPARADVSFSFFYSNLSPYGSWAVSADYGQVWRPYDDAPGWNPYYDGHWVYTDYGWAWVSDYAWGSVPYHYGTWALDPALGWIWVPGYVWAPSWVAFTSGPDYIGWAPVPPRYVVGASISFNAFAPDRCVIVPARSFLAPRVRGYALPRANVQVALERTHVVNNIRIQNHVVVNHGPDPRGIERAAGRPIRTEPIDRVRHVVPNGRFDAQEVRADRHSGGGAPRVTAPEPAYHSAPAHQSVAGHQGAPASRPAQVGRYEPAGRYEPGRYEPAGRSAPATGRAQGHAPQTQARPEQPQPLPQQPHAHQQQPQAARQSQQSAPQQPLGQPGHNRSQPPKSGKPANKPPHGGGHDKR